MSRQVYDTQCDDAATPTTPSSSTCTGLPPSCTPLHDTTQQQQQDNATDSASENGEESFFVQHSPPSAHRKTLEILVDASGDRPPPTLPTLSNPHPARLAACLSTLAAVPIPSTTPLKHVASALITAHGVHDTFFVVDLGIVQRLYDTWMACLPRVHPFYAVKCNPDRGLVAFLAALGCGFDCATQAEIEQVAGLVADANMVIYAHPCKPPHQLQAAAAAGVGLVTFDTVCELRKVCLGMMLAHACCSSRITAHHPLSLLPYTHPVMLCCASVLTMPQPSAAWATSLVPRHLTSPCC